MDFFYLIDKCSLSSTGKNENTELAEEPGTAEQLEIERHR